jgi:hypothetical protein
MHRLFLLISVAATLLALSGCLYDNPPSGPSCNIDTWLVGQWDATDKSGRTYHTVVSPDGSSHYRITLSGGGRSSSDYDAWISRVDGFSVLVVKALAGNAAGKYALFHHELLAAGTPPPGGIGATRIRLTELQLDPSAATLDPYHLRRDIRDALKAGTLLPPYDVVADRKQQIVPPVGSGSAGNDGRLANPSSVENKRTGPDIAVPGSVVWTRSGGVTLNGQTF